MLTSKIYILFIEDDLPWLSVFMSSFYFFKMQAYSTESIFIQNLKICSLIYPSGI